MTPKKPTIFIITKIFLFLSSLFFCVRLRVTNEAIVTLIDGFMHVEEASLFGMFELDVVYERES